MGFRLSWMMGGGACDNRGPYNKDAGEVQSQTEVDVMMEATGGVM